MWLDADIAVAFKREGLSSDLTLCLALDLRGSRLRSWKLCPKTSSSRYLADFAMARELANWIPQVSSGHHMIVLSDIIFESHNRLATIQNRTSIPVEALFLIDCVEIDIHTSTPVFNFEKDLD